ncbi:hypothetical protein BDA96_10G116200 [Sorghum bicolor]|uniref:Uncharacterized protein n=1 Tax=Sorghum bicolor TaxID=4558 RepID=A0A921Q299_SORBI|nr:hypothetical protein BDA96_10G116200 [Sorghum bicolor]
MEPLWLCSLSGGGAPSIFHTRRGLELVFQRAEVKPGEAIHLPTRAPAGIPLLLSARASVRSIFIKQATTTVAHQRDHLQDAGHVLRKKYEAHVQKRCGNVCFPRD